MRSWLRDTASETQRQVQQLQAAQQQQQQSQSQKQQQQNSRNNSDDGFYLSPSTASTADEMDDDDDDMPPLLETTPLTSPTPSALPSNSSSNSTKKSKALTPATSSSSSSSSSTAEYGGLHPAPARFAFRPTLRRCIPDYSCCLRYRMKLATCCMPNTNEFKFVPSFSWLQSKFYALHADDATLEFLHQCDENFYEGGWCSSWGLRVGVLKPLLRRCMAHTDVNGLLKCGEMFLTSSAQIESMLKRSIREELKGRKGMDWPWSKVSDGAAQHATMTFSSNAASSSFSSSTPAPGSRHLDIGAGDGHITSFISPFFSSTSVTEVARQMISRLTKRGFEHVIHTGDLDEGLPLSSEIVGEGFDCITLFNVLDRCSKPRTLLKQILARLRKPRKERIDGLEMLVNTSRVILSVPLPLDPSVEVGTRWLDPEESILSHSRSLRDYESSICALAEMLLSMGFNIESISRIPYLSQGDTWRPFYVLDASVWVLSARWEGEMTPKEEEMKKQAAATNSSSSQHSSATSQHQSSGGSEGHSHHKPQQPRYDITREVD